MINEELRLVEVVSIVADNLRIHARAQAQFGHPVPSEAWILDAARNVAAALYETLEAVEADGRESVCGRR
jgi:hypothetical protein